MSDWDSAPLAGPPEKPADNGWQSAPLANPPEPNSTDADRHIAASPGIGEAKTPYESLLAGLQISASGLQFHGKPSLEEPVNANFWQKLGYGLGQGVGDLPYNIVGAAAGAIGGAAVPGAGETGIGETAGAGAGAMALPQAVRELYMDYYKRGEVHSFSDFMAMFANSAWAIGKQAATGAVLGPLAGKAGAATEAATGSAYVGTAANLTTYATGATGVNAALDGKAPDAGDFAVNMVAAVGMHVGGSMVGGVFQPSHAGTRVMDNMEKIYRQTGVPPWEQAQRAKTDPVFKQELFTKDVNGEPSAPKFNATRPPDPEPFKAPETEHDVAAHVEELLPMVRGLEGSTDTGPGSVSPKGAIGRFQIMPGTARQYGFDPAKLHDAAYNEAVARTVLSDLSRRFHGDTEAVLVAYNAGPGRAIKFLRDGRDTSELPKETQRYLIHAGFGKGNGEPPEPPPTEPPAGAEGPDWKAASDATLSSRFANRIGEEPAVKEKSARMGWEFELSPLREVDKGLERQGLLRPEDVGLEDMIRMTYGSDSRASHFLHEGPVDAIDMEKKLDGPSFSDAMKAIDDAGGTRLDFSRYVLSLRSVAKGKEGIDLGLFKPGEAEENVRRLGSQYTKANALLQKWNDSVLQYGEDSGAISAAQRKAMNDKNLMAYMSIRRIMGDDAPFNVGGGKGKLARNKNPLRMMEGSNRDIADPLIATQDNMRKFIRFADRVRATGAIVGSTELRGALGLKRVEWNPKAMLAEPGSDVFKPYALDDKTAEAIQPLAVKATGIGPNQFIHYNKGVPELWEARNEDLARVIRGTDSPGEATLVGKIGRAAAAFERGAVVGSPDFGIRVALRHQMTLWETGVNGLHPPPFVLMLKNIMEVWNKGDEFQRMERLGGFPGQLGYKKTFAIDMAAQRPDLQQKLWNVVSSPLAAARLLTETTSSAARLGVAQYAEGKGRSPLKAAMIARVGLLDYDERFLTNFMNKWASWTPFMRAGALGLRFAKDGVVNMAHNPARVALRVGLGLVLPTVTLGILNRKQDEHLPEHLKSTNLPQYYQDNYINTPYIPSLGHRLHIPLPYVIGPAIHAPLVRLLQVMLDHDPHAGDDILRDTMGDMVPSFLPALLKPALEDQMNYNFYSGKPLMSDSMKGYTRDMQYTDSTTPLAKKVSSLLGGHNQTGEGITSPVVMDNYVREWGGTLGFQVLQALNAPFREAKSAPSDLTDAWFVRWLVQRNPDMNAKPIDDFYKDATQFEAQNHDVMKELKDGNEQQAIVDHGEAGAKAGLAMRVQRALGVVRTAVHAINANPKFTDDEKRQFSERLYDDAIRIAKYGSGLLRGTAPSEEAAQALSDQTQIDVRPAQ